MASYVSRKRWEYREQAIAHFTVQGEAMGASKATKQTTAPPVGEFRQNSGGINQGPPPLAELRKLGLEIEM